MLHAVITTIQEPTDSVRMLVEKVSALNGRLVVAGDSKGPAAYDGPDNADWPVDFLSLEDQLSAGFSLAAKLPTKHYSRKNIGYLHAIRAGATCIYETDDDNAPNERWAPRSEWMKKGRIVAGAGNRWVNVYKYFTSEHIWPRGLPLDEIRAEAPPFETNNSPRRSPIQQGLVDGSPDVDAIWRLTLDREFSFDSESSIFLAPGNWCPFNTQTTWWWPLAFPLLYVPSHCSFRMCDIWKSFIAQRCLWAMNLGIVFHPSEVFQLRNPHDLTIDFRDEIPGYSNNRLIAEILEAENLSADPADVSSNLRLCYQRLVDHAIFPRNELPLVDSWLDDCASARGTS